jgi:speckle-type POZ protein
MEVHNYPPADSDWGWPGLVLRRRVLKSLYLTNGSFIIVGAVKVAHDNPIDVPPSDIGSHLGLLLDCTDGSDVSFVVDGVKFPAHRAVLAARSPVFKAQLLGSMAGQHVIHHPA